MRRSERNSLRTLYQFWCGYCGATEVDAGGELTADHFQPRSRAGVDTLDNLVYACIACNDFKGDYWILGSSRRILHPLRDDLTAHIRETDEGILDPLTETGKFHIERLHLNRSQLIAQRKLDRELKALRRTLMRLQAENEALRQHIGAVEEQLQMVLDEANQHTGS